MKALLAAALVAAAAQVVRASGPDFDGKAQAPARALESPFPPPAAEPSAPPKGGEAAANVVLLMFDGLRWQEFFGNKPDPLLESKDAGELLPHFWSVLAPQGVVYGDERAGGLMSVSNFTMVSLPGYQSIFAGEAQPCLDNKCGRVRVETFPERLIRELRLPREAVASFSSWEAIPLAFEHVPGATWTDTPGTGDPQAERTDDATWPLALSYLKEKKPRFLFISLNDTDAYGHRGDHPAYLASIRKYDVWMKELVELLDGLGDYGRDTTLIVTTDHGRGVGDDWRNHGALAPWCGQVWMYVRGPKVPRSGPIGGEISHADIRPSVEALFGLAPLACEDCGRALTEIVGPAPAVGSPSAAP